MTDQFPESPELEPLTRTQVLIAMGVTAIILLLITKVWLQFGSVALMSVKWSASAITTGLILGIAITIASSIVYSLWAAYRQSADFYLELVLKPLVWPDLIWLGLLPGLSEELLFRGVMLPAFGFNVEGLIVSSLFFGVLHLSNLKQWPYVVWATVVGGVLGGSLIVTDNLLVPILAHITTNLVSSSLWKWSDRSQNS